MKRKPVRRAPARRRRRANPDAAERRFAQLDLDDRPYASGVPLGGDERGRLLDLGESLNLPAEEDTSRGRLLDLADMPAKEWTPAEVAAEEEAEAERLRVRFGSATAPVVDVRPAAPALTRVARMVAAERSAAEQLRELRGATDALRTSASVQRPPRVVLSDDIGIDPETGIPRRVEGTDDPNEVVGVMENGNRIFRRDLGPYVNLGETQVAGRYRTRIRQYGGPDLHGANLRNADLSGANLLGANLLGADLRNADLSGANLLGANLLGADLRTANLRGVDLSGADLRGANMGNADLLGADLRTADLRTANLRGANLRTANLRGAAGQTRTTLGAQTTNWNENTVWPDGSQG
jgi:hypothetical protein